MFKNSESLLGIKIHKIFDNIFEDLPENEEVQQNQEQYNIFKDNQHDINGYNKNYEYFIYDDNDFNFLL